MFQVFCICSLFMCSNASFGLMYCVSSFLYSVLYLCVRMLLLD